MMRISSILPAAQRHLVRIRDDQQVTEAASLLADTTRHMVVVCDSIGTMMGVVTRTDIVRQIQNCQGCACTTACTTVMTKTVTFCHPDDWLHEVWAEMKTKGLQSIPIVNSEHQPIGLVAARDALESLLSEVEHEEELLRDYVMCVGYH